MSDKRLHDLVLHTLYGWRIEPRDSSIRTNEAGDELANCSSAAIPIIESVICNIVLPTLGHDDDRGSQNPADCEVLDDFGDIVGLNYLLGAYLVIGVRSDSERIFDFLLQLPPKLLMEAVSCASTFFWKTNHGYDFGVAPNDKLISFLREVGALPISRLANAASDVRLELEEHMRQE